MWMQWNNNFRNLALFAVLDIYANWCILNYDALTNASFAYQNITFQQTCNTVLYCNNRLSSSDQLGKFHVILIKILPFSLVVIPFEQPWTKQHCLVIHELRKKPKVKGKYSPHEENLAWMSEKQSQRGNDTAVVIGASLVKAVLLN